MAVRSRRRDRGDCIMLDNLREDWVTHDRDIWRQGLWVMAYIGLGDGAMGLVSE